MKRYGGGQEAPKSFEFELEVLRGDDPEVHQFVASPRVGAGDMIRMVVADEDKPEEQLKALANALARSISDKDGVPAKWKPEELPRAKDVPDAFTSSEFQLPGDPAQERAYRGPDGNIHPFSDTETLAYFQDVRNGSSRRRWLHVLLGDDEVFVRLSTLNEIAKDFIAASTGHPTVG